MCRIDSVEVDGVLWPVGLEVRLKQRPCHHDEPPPGAVTRATIGDAIRDATGDGGDSGDFMLWERRECDCWPPAGYVDPAAVPAGGLPARLLRRVRFADVRRRYRRAAVFTAAAHGTPRVATFEHLARVKAAAADDDRNGRRGPKQGGRPPLPPELHLHRLSVLNAAYERGGKQETAARELGVSVATLRESLRWARARRYWTAEGSARRGELTATGRQAIREYLHEGAR